MNADSTSNAAGNARAFRSIGYALVFLMMLCIVMAISRLIHLVMPAWPSGVMAGVMLLIVIDRLLIHQRLRSLGLFGREWALTLGTQWIVFVVFIRLLLSYAKGIEAFLADMRLFGRGQLEDLLSPEFIVTLLLAMLAWYVPAMFLEALDEIGLDQALALGAEPGLVQSDAVAAHQRLVSLIFSLGIGLVLLTAAGRVDLRAVLSDPGRASLLNPNQFTGAEAGVLVYFIFGLALLAQARLMSLQTRWNVQRIPISSDNLARKWGLYSLVFLSLIVMLVSLLPAGDSFGFFSVLQMLLTFLLSVLFFLWQLIIGVILILLSIPYFLMGRSPPVLDQIPIAPVLPPAVTQPLPTEGSAIWAWIRSILLWGSVLLIIVFSLRQFIRQHDSLTSVLRKAPVIGWLIQAWQWLRRGADRTRAGLVRVVTESWQRIAARLERNRALPRGGYINLRSLDPRRRVYFFYLAMVRRGDEQGLTRKPSQTPSEYAQTLEKALPEAGEDIDSITQAFIEARYSSQEVDAGKADFVKAIWGRIRRALQSKAKDEGASDQ